MSAAPVDVQPRPCCMCGSEVPICSSTTRDLEAPEMLKLPYGAWVGFVRGDHGPEMIVVCSEECRATLLRD